MSDLPPRKPWAIEQFQQHRSHLCSFVDTKLVPLIREDGCHRILVRAPVKSGKREIAEYTALRDFVKHDPKRVHGFVSAWHRTADDDQRKELKDHNLHVFSIISRDAASECIEWVRRQIVLGCSVVIHLDECDHGTGSRQILGRVWREIRENQKVTTILYSATPEEVLFSDEVDEDVDGDFTDLVDTMISSGCYLHYVPMSYNPAVSTTSGFCGPATFLNENLVEDATPFFRKSHGTYQLTPQGRAICSQLREGMRHNPKRNIIVLRLSYSQLGKGRTNRKESKAIYQFLDNIDCFPELADFIVLVDKQEETNERHRSDRVLKERIQWSSNLYWNSKTTAIPILVIVDQTSTRSTEWKFHDRIYAYHDFRNILVFGTNSQAFERVNHYADKYGGFQPIKVYANRKTFELSAGRIDYERYLVNEWTPRKVDRRRTGENEVYEIKHTETDELHPECAGGPLSKEEKDRVLQECASFAKASLSQRVRGTVRNVAKVKVSQHIPCSSTEEFETVSSSVEFRSQVGDHVFRNPFRNPQMDGDRVMGYLREWKVFQYSEIENQRWGFNVTTNSPRVTICYKDGVLGIALRTLDGFEQLNTLTAFKTMYRTN